MWRGLKSSQPEESRNDTDSSFFKRILSTNTFTFGAEEEVAPIYWRGLTFKKLLSYVGLWGVFEEIGQFIVLIIHEVYTHTDLTEAIAAELLTFAPTESFVPSSSPYPTESYQPTKPTAESSFSTAPPVKPDLSTPFPTYPSPMPTSSVPTTMINPSAGTISPPFGSKTPFPTTPMPASSGPTTSTSPTTETMAPTVGGTQTVGGSLTISPTIGALSYWVPNWHNVDFSKGTCVRKDGAFGISEALPNFADQVTCCEVAFKDQESQACLREAGALSDEVYWFPDYSVAFSIGTCQNRTGSAQPDMPHFSSQRQCCSIAFDNQNPEVCLKQLPDYSTSWGGINDAYKYSEWAFAVSHFMFSAWGLC